MTNRERYRAAFAIHAPSQAVRAALDRAQRPHHRLPLRPLLAAAVLLALLITAASAEVNTGSVSNFLAPLFGASRTQLLDVMGRPVGASASAGGYTVTAQSILGDQSHMAVVYTITREDGQPFSGQCQFDSWQSTGLTGSHSYYQFSMDEDPEDSQVEFYQVYSVTTLPRTLNVSFAGLCLIDGEERLPLADGPWELSFTRRYPIVYQEIPAKGISFTDAEGGACTIHSLSLSYLGLHLSGSFPADSSESALRLLDLYVTLDDGSIVPLRSSSLYTHSAPMGSGTEFDWHPLYGDLLTMALVPMDEVASITIGGVTIPVS